MVSAPPARVLGVAAVAACLVVAVISTSPLHSPLNNPNEGVRVFTVKALVEQHTFRIDDVVRTWGYIDDKSTKDGHLFQSKAPLPTLLAAAAYGVVHPFTGDLSRTALTRLCRVSGSLLPTAILLALTWRRLRRRRGNDDDDGDVNSDTDNTIVDAVMVSLVVGTGVLSTLHVFSGHAIAAAASALLMAVVRDAAQGEANTRGIRDAALAGAVVGVAVGAEYPAILSAPLALVVIKHSSAPWRACVVCAIACLVALMPTLIAHQLMWGAPYKTGYSFLENAAYRPLVAGTLFGIGGPDGRALFTSFLSPELGLFFFSPLLVLGCVSVFRPSTWMGAFERVVVVAVVVAYVLFIAGFRGWRGGWSVGPRYISELAGLLSVLAVDALPRLSTRLRLGVVVALGGIGIVHSGVAGAFFPHLSDVFRTPVGSCVLPAVWRGFSPDSVWLFLGAASSTSALLIVLSLFLPLALVASRHRGSVFALVVVAVVAAVANLSLAKHSRADALEARRMMDNWRPETGNPYLDGAVDDAALFAVDRARDVARPADACAKLHTRSRRRDVGHGADALAAALAQSRAELIVVDDALADHIGAAGGSALIVAVADVRRLRRAPCRGDVDVVLPVDAPWPAALRAALRPASQAPTATLDEGYVLWAAERAPPLPSPMFGVAP